MQHPRVFPASAVEDGLLYMIAGGEIDIFLEIVPHLDIEVYDTVAGNWRMLPTQVPASILFSSRAVEVDGLIYLIGGHDDLSTLTDRASKMESLKTDGLFGIVRHPRPYAFSRQSHAVIEYWIWDRAAGTLEVEKGLNLTRRRGEDATD